MAKLNKLTKFFGYIYESDDLENGQLRYLASVDLNEEVIPMPCLVITNVPATQYAIVPHHEITR